MVPRLHFEYQKIELQNHQNHLVPGDLNLVPMDELGVGDRCHNPLKLQARFTYVYFPEEVGSFYYFLSRTCDFSS